MLATDRQIGRPSVCNHCGFVLSDNDTRTDLRMKYSYLASVVLTSLFIITGFIQLANWGSNSFEIMFLKVSEWTGTVSVGELERMAKICLEAKKYNCAEARYAQIANKEPSTYLRLGKLQIAMSKYPEAVDSLRTYLARNEQDLEGMYLYGRALGEVGQVDAAARYYNRVIDAKPKVVPVTVVQNYVKLLVRHGRLGDARNVIDRIRKRDISVSGFMTEEYLEIQRRLQGAGHAS